MVTGIGDISGLLTQIIPNSKPECWRPIQMLFKTLTTQLSMAN